VGFIWQNREGDKLPWKGENSHLLGNCKKKQHLSLWRVRKKDTRPLQKMGGNVKIPVGSEEKGKKYSRLPKGFGKGKG